MLRQFALLACALAAALAPIPGAHAGDALRPKTIRISCLGDSITAGVNTANAQWDSYPAQLHWMLGDGYTVSNFSANESTVLNGEDGYAKTKEFQRALESEPDVVTIMLGANDSKPKYVAARGRFAADYRGLIARVQRLKSHPRIFVCLPSLVTGEGAFGITENVIQQEIPVIRKIAEEQGLGLIDMHLPLRGQEEMVPDFVHPNTQGHALLARAIYRTILAKEFGGTSERHSEWEGYARTDSRFSNRAWWVVAPKKAAAGNPWIWRMETFGNDPGVDKELLEKGFHVAFLDLKDTYGAPKTIEAMNGFYGLMTGRGMAPKVILEAFNRGALCSFNWAVGNAARVAAICAEAPVLDFRSWPGGKGKGKGSPEDWLRLLKRYDLTEAQAMVWRQNPVDSLAPLAAARIPIIFTGSDPDETVPPEENCKLARARYLALGGEIKVSLKRSTDHSNRIADSAQILTFLKTKTAGSPGDQ